MRSLAAVAQPLHRRQGAPGRWPVRAMARRRTEAEMAYEQEAFAIDWERERERATCSKVKSSVTWRAGHDKVGGPRVAAVFSRSDCGAFAARDLCTPAKQARREELITDQKR